MNNNNTTYKDSPLGKIPVDWGLKRVGKMTKTAAGGTPSTSVEEYWGGDIKWMSSGELNLKKVYDVEGRITELGLKNSSTKIIPIKCVLIGLAGQGKTRGTVAMNMIELCTNQSVAAIFPGNDFYEDYLFYNLDFRYEELRQLSTGEGGRGGLNLNIINSVLIPLPPLPEQKAIAHLLGLIDSAINTNNQLIAQKELQKKWLMQQLLSEKLIVKNEKWCKSGVRKVFIGEIALVKKGKLIVENKIRKGNIPVIAGGKTSPYSHDAYTDERVITISASGAYAGFVSFHENKIWASDCSVLNALDKEIDMYYLFYHLIFNQEKIYKLQRGGAQPHVFPKDIFHFSLFIINSLGEQTAIAKVLQAADKEIHLLKTKTERLREQKKGLMQVLLTGKKRLTIKL